MDVIKSTRLWDFLESKTRRSIRGRGKDDELESKFATRLKESFIRFRERTSILVNQIDSSFRQLTVHDIEHIDALWQMADLLIDDDYPLNPAEVYVLGGAFLLHDAGLALASYRDGGATLATNELWKGCAAILFRKKFGRSIRQHEFSTLTESMREEATEWFLRRNHAAQAEGLGIVGFRERPEDTEQFLLEDSELRHLFGPLIGRIAYSHWWPGDKLALEFDTMHGAFPNGPANWTVDPLKLAILLRVADALQLDYRRAPLLRKTLRRPTGNSADHCKFQHYMPQPCRHKGGILFSTSSTFSVEDAGAWWILHFPTNA